VLSVEQLLQSTMHTYVIALSCPYSLFLGRIINKLLSLRVIARISKTITIYSLKCTKISHTTTSRSRPYGKYGSFKVPFRYEFEIPRNLKSHARARSSYNVITSYYVMFRQVETRKILRTISWFLYSVFPSE